MPDNIFQRMSMITQEITAVAKNLSVGTGKNQYKAVGEPDVLAAVRPVEAKHGVYSYPISREIVESGTLEKENQYGKTIQNYMRIKVVYRFLCIDNPASHMDIESFGDGVDAQDKAPGKAMTYADKYALMKAYKIITGDDPDQYESEEYIKKQQNPRQQSQTKQQKPQEKEFNPNEVTEKQAKLNAVKSLCQQGKISEQAIINVFRQKKPNLQSIDELAENQLLWILKEENWVYIK
jgi:hypothetical protein